METKHKVEKTAKREIFPDVLRIAATCTVVLMHTITGVWDHADMSVHQAELMVFFVTMDLITWCVPIFVLISGYLFLNPKRKITLRQMLRKYCRRIVLALFLFGVPFACLELVAARRTFTVGMLWESVLMVLRGQSWSHMWYLYMILALYLITPALKYLLERCPAWVLYAVLGVLAVGSSILPYLKKLFLWEWMAVLPDGGIYLFYYLCGYLFAVRGNKEKGNIERGNIGKQNAGKKNAGSGRLQKAVGAVAILLPVGMVASRLTRGYWLQMAYNYPFTVILSLAIFYLAQTAEQKRNASSHDAETASGRTKAVERINSLCFAVYLIHPVFVNLAYKFLYITPLDFPIWLSLPGFCTAILALSFPAAWVLYHIPGMAKHVL